MGKRRNVWIPELHPRGPNGKFIKRGGGQSVSSWQRTVANMSSPGIRVQRPRRGELPGGARNVTDLMGKMKSGEVSWWDRDTVDRLTGYFDRTTSFHDHESGMRVLVVGVKPSERGNIQINYQIRDNAGIEIGTATRMWVRRGDDFMVEHAYFSINRQGGGLAARWNRNNEDAYRANGVKEITLQANISVGGYAWAKQGYDFATPESMMQMDVRVRNRLRDGKYSRETLAPEQKKRLDDLRARSTMEHWEAGTAPTPLEWAMVGWTPGATTWLGKELLLGSSWDGVKHL